MADFNSIWQQTLANQQSAGASTGMGGGAIGCFGAPFANFKDTQGLWGTLMPNWMEATIGGTRRPPGGLHGALQKMHQELQEMNKAELAKLSEGGHGLIGPASDFSGSPTSGLSAPTGGGVEIG